MMAGLWLLPLLLMTVIAKSQCLHIPVNATCNNCSTTTIARPATTQTTTRPPPPSPKPKPANCYEVKKLGKRANGVYTIYLGSTKRSVKAYCDMRTQGGGWTVFQRRKDGTVKFYRNYASYKHGFGNPAGEFWLGNDNIHLLTKNWKQTLRIDMQKWDGRRVYALYTKFVVGSGAQRYKLLSLGVYKGNAGDWLRHQWRQYFGTYDRPWSIRNCAKLYKGGWWYKPSMCHNSHLNGIYLPRGKRGYGFGVNWKSFTSLWGSLKFVEMKVRPT